MQRRALLALLVLAAFACSRPPGKKGPVVAAGGGVVITADQLKARLDEQSPMARQSFQTLERKKQFLDNMLQFELLAKAAEREGLAKDPEVQFAMKRVMVSKYYQRFFQDPEAAKKVPEADVQKYYDEHKDEFHRPARIHAAHVLVAAEGADRAKKEASAKKLLAKILAEEPKNPGAFAAAARESSDDAATKSVGGDLGLKTAEELEKAYGKELVDAVFKAQDGKTSERLVQTPKGFHLVRALGRQAELNRSFDEVKGQIAARLAAQKKSKDFEAFVKKLRDDAKVKVYEEELEKVSVAAAPGAGPGMGAMRPPHGAMPPPAQPAPAAPAQGR